MNNVKEKALVKLVVSLSVDGMVTVWNQKGWALEIDRGCKHTQGVEQGQIGDTIRIMEHRNIIVKTGREEDSMIGVLIRDMGRRGHKRSDLGQTGSGVDGTTNVTPIVITHHHQIHTLGMVTKIIVMAMSHVTNTTKFQSKSPTTLSINNWK